jgi:hypothetical protein
MEAASSRITRCDVALALPLAAIAQIEVWTGGSSTGTHAAAGGAAQALAGGRLSETLAANIAIMVLA